MAVPFLAAGMVAVVASVLAAYSGTTRFLPGACERVDGFLASQIVGQDLAINQLVSAMCVHLEKAQPNKPLIISVHGPPGVGKTFTHSLLARALYNKRPEEALKCPGVDCIGYKVLYGLDFPAAKRQEQLAAVEESLMAHLRSVKDALLVFEEYDKMDCTARKWLRRLLSHAHDADGGAGALSRSIVLLESNLGWVELEQMLSAVKGDTSKLSYEKVEAALRDVLFARWRSAHDAAAGSAGAGSTAGSHGETNTTTGAAAGDTGDTCSESYVDTLRFTTMVDFFLPYLPLQRREVEVLAQRGLQDAAAQLLARKGVVMKWQQPQVIKFLASKVDFDGPYPLEGAKQVSTVITRYIAPAVRKCPDHKASQAKHKRKHKDTQEAPPVLELSVRGQDLMVTYPQLPAAA